MNAPLTPRECVEHVFAKIDKLILQGISEAAALKVIADEYKIEFKKLLHLWLNRARAR